MAPNLLSTSSFVYPAISKALYIIFGSWFLIAPLEASKPFKKQWLKYYEEIPLNVHRYVFIDPAISQADSADFTACAVDGSLAAGVENGREDDKDE